jgi:integrase
MKNSASPRVFHCFPNPSAFGAHFRKVICRAGIIGLRLHDLRHEAISRLCTKFPQTEKIMEIVGHRSYDTLLRYRHFKAKDVVGLFG